MGDKPDNCYSQFLVEMFYSESPSLPVFFCLESTMETPQVPCQPAFTCLKSRMETPEEHIINV